MEEPKLKKKPKGVELSRSTGIRYNAELQKIVNEINADIRALILPMLRKLEPQYQADAYAGDVIAALQSLLGKWGSPLFKTRANAIASSFVRTANTVNQSAFNRDFGINSLTPPANLDDYFEMSIYENVNLIESIPDQYLTQVQTIVTQNVRAGNRHEDISKELQERFGVSKSRAKLIARDQTAKINGDLSAKRQQSAGFAYFQWVTSKDIRVRDRHKHIAKRTTKYGHGVYSWDDLPLSVKGQPIKPGDDYQCRCIAVPVHESQVKKFQKSV